MQDFPEARDAIPVTVELAAQVALAAGVGLFVSIVLAGVTLLLA